MSDFITRLAQRQLGQLATVEPKLPSRFAASAPTAPMPVIDGAFTIPHRRQDGAVRLPSQAVPVPFVHRDREPARVSRRPDNEGERPVRGSTAAADSPRGLLTIDDPAEPALLTLLVRPTMAPRGVETAVPPCADSDPPALVRSPAAPAPHDAPKSNAARAESVPPLLVKTSALAPQAAPPRLETKPAQDGTLAADRTYGAEPPIQVTIGRIEVTALTQAAPAKRSAAARKPAMSLDDYLARRRRRPS
jgi:hypothetical protein